MGLLHTAWLGLATALILATLVWAASVALRDVSIVDSAWSLPILSVALPAVLHSGGLTPRAWLALGLAGAWALRLSAHITWRHWGEEEDRRYQEIRARNQPGFQWKSLYLVFWLQALLAAVVALPLLGSVKSGAALGWLDAAGAVLAAFGVLFEAVADMQLTRFKAKPAHRGKVMDQGLWRYSRHPNYFGEVCVWWGLWLLALSAGAWWSVLSPLLMTVLLLKVSGVTLLEKDMQERRPAYRDYIARTPAFFPGKPKP